MNDKHIIDLLDSVPLGSLDETQLNLVREHARACAECNRAFTAAQLLSVSVRERAASTVEPSPFFQTRVLAALREQQANNSVPAFLRLWRSARMLVSSMAVTTAALAVLSFMVPAPSSVTVEQTASAYSAESVILDQLAEEQLTYEQVLSTIYADEDEGK
jgi:anti-sigma factor RsiW